MGNRLCCGGRWSCPSIFQRKKKTGNQARPLSKQQQQQQRQLRQQQQQQRQQQQNGTKDHETPGQMYERVLKPPESQQRSQGFTSEDNNLHYADIQVCSQTRSRSAREVKHLQSANATEYATLYFPQATPCYDSKNGTLV